MLSINSILTCGQWPRPFTDNSGWRSYMEQSTRISVMRLACAATRQPGQISLIHLFSDHHHNIHNKYHLLDSYLANLIYSDAFF